MKSRASGNSFLRARLIVLLLLLSQLMNAVGWPLPTSRLATREASQAYPCQSRPCGCLSAEACWQGDCCCFTLEQKLAWADVRQIEPPAHVRPLVQARRLASRGSKKSTCCAASGQPTRNLADCCSAEQIGCADCEIAGSACAAKNESPKSEAISEPQSVPARWVIGLFARQCRGELAGSLFGSEPLFFDRHILAITRPERTEVLVPFALASWARGSRPPIPPPRSSETSS